MKTDKDTYYGDFFDFDKEDVLPLMEPTRSLIDVILLEVDKIV